MGRLATFLVAAAAIAAAVSAAAQPPAAEDDIVDRIISVPVPSRYTVQGVRSPRVRDDENVQGGKALRIQVPGRSEQAWSVSVSVPITRAVRAGDQLILAFWARLERGEDGATSSTLPYNAVQLASAPYTAVMHGPATITPEWAMYEVQGRADRDYPADSLNVSIHLATAHQTVDIGPVFVLDMGQ